MTRPLAFRIALATAALLAAPATGFAHGGSSAGPMDGRVVTAAGQSWDLLVRADRHLQLARFDAASRAVLPVEGWTIQASVGDRLAPTTLTFAAEGDLLVSTAPLPASQTLPAILRVTPPEGAGTAGDPFARLVLDLNTCSGCSREEYRCTCEH